MVNVRKVAFATGSRADYGIMRRVLFLLNDDKDIELVILTTGTLLNKDYGNQIDIIYEDGFFIDAKLDMPIDTSSNVKILNSMSMVQNKFAEYFSRNCIDLLIILGDRYEMLSVAIAAAMQKVPILHIHGGESTYGNYDEFIRHSITKMSLYHFTATENYRKRVIQLGESPDRVFYLGALGAENCFYSEENNILPEIKSLPRKKYFVVLFHPETLTNVNIFEQIKELLNALEEFSDFKFVFLGSNADTNSNIIRREIKMFLEKNQNVLYFENLRTSSYHYLLKNSICLIGNSSSGIIEAPSLGIYTINIGDRQKGRIKGNSVIDVKCKSIEIKDAIRKVFSVYNSIDPVNPYYKKNSAFLYYKTIKKLLNKVKEDKIKPKEFYDIY